MRIIHNPNVGEAVGKQLNTPRAQPADVDINTTAVHQNRIYEPVAIAVHRPGGTLPTGNWMRNPHRSPQVWAHEESAVTMGRLISV